jgi:Mn-dependent DtxR family transcriptional regulator
MKHVTLTTPHEDYLERIWELLDQKGYARVTDIAARLGVQPASVTMMVKKLEGSGYIVRERYRGFTLSAKGRAVGSRIGKRHKILSEFLHLLKLPDRIIEKDIEGMEHFLSDETLVKLEGLVRKIQKP